MFNRGSARLVCIALVVLASQVGSRGCEERNDFRVTVERAIVRYRVAMTTFEMRGQAETTYIRTTCIMVFRGASISGDRRSILGRNPE